MFWFEVFSASLIGLVFGSFSTALSYRIPHNLDWVNQRSACPNCKAFLGVADLFPILSWVCSKGKCRHCASVIPARYPLTELAAMVFCVCIYLRFGFSVEGLFLMVAVPFLVSLIVIDIDHLILPDILVFILLAIGIVRLHTMSFLFSEASIDAVSYYLSAATYGALAWILGEVVSRVLKKDALGFGDVKFFVVAGLWLGFVHLANFVLLSGICGVVLAILWKKIGKGDVFPFGPALIMSFVLLLLYQGQTMA